MPYGTEELYTVRETAEGFRVVKFDKWFNVTRVYELRSTRVSLSCSCFQAKQPDCRHRKIVRLFERKKFINLGWFYDYDRGTWQQPISFWRRW